MRDETKETSRSKNRVLVYTDGACSGNPGPGGWAAVIETDGGVKEISGREANSTNNRMEMMAIIKALQNLGPQTASVEIRSDSGYIVNAFNQKWLDKWQRNGWRTSGGDAVKNRDLWEELLGQVRRFASVTLTKVKGHSDCAGNNRANDLAQQEAARIGDELQGLGGTGFGAPTVRDTAALDTAAGRVHENKGSLQQVYRDALKEIYSLILSGEEGEEARALADIARLIVEGHPDIAEDVEEKLLG